MIHKIRENQPTGLHFELIFLEISDILFSFLVSIFRLNYYTVVCSTNTSDVYNTVSMSLFVVVVGIPKKSRGVQKMEIG